MAKRTSSKGRFIGLAFPNRDDQSTFDRVDLGIWSHCRKEGWKVGNDESMEMLMDLYPDAEHYEIYTEVLPEVTERIADLLLQL